MRGALQRYRAVLVAPHATALLGSSFVARLQIGMASIALVLLVEEERHSYALAGAAAACFAAADGIGQQVWARRVDRRGRGILLPLTVINVTALVGVVLAVHSSLPGVVILLLAAVAGGAFPPLAPISRATWPVLLADRPALISAALALESVAIELIFTSGPLLVVAFGAVGSPGTALLVGAGLTLVGAVAFLLKVPPRDLVTAERARGGALRSPGLRTVVLATLPVGMCFGAMEVALPAFADHQGNDGLGGLPVALWAFGSMIGGLVYGAREFTGPLGPRWVRFLAVLPLGYLVLAAAPGLTALVALAFFAGMLIAPTLTAAYQLAGELAPRGTETEAMAWPITALVVGIASGNAITGALVEAFDVRVAMLAAAGACAVGGVIAAARRGTLAGSQVAR